MPTGVYIWSQTAATNSSADSAVNWAEGQAPSSVNDSARAMMASVAKWRDDITGTLVTTGTSTAYAIASNQGISANTDGFTVQFTPGLTNGAIVTLSVDSQTAKPLRFLTGIDLPAGVLVSGSLYQATYRAAASEWLLHGFDSSIYSIPIGGSIEYWGAAAPNSCFALAQGQAISRTTYATLFGLVGTTYGVGNGSTTFNIPDKVGRVCAMLDGGSARISASYFGGNPANLGATGGGESHTLTTNEIPAHSHANSLTDPGHGHTGHGRLQGTAGAGTSTEAMQGGNNTASIDTQTLIIASSTSGISITNANAGGGVAHNIVQPTIICNHIIRII